MTKLLDSKISESDISYGASPAVSDHIPSYLPSLTPARQASAWLSNPGKMENWAELL